MEAQEKPEERTDGPQASEQEDFNADPEPDTRGQIAEPKCATGKCETNVVQERRTEETPAAAMTQMSFSSVETCADKWYKASKGAKELGVELELKRHKLALKEMPILQQAVEELIRLRKNDWSNSKWLGKRGYHYGEKAGGVLLGAGLGGLGVAGDLTHMAGAAIMDAAGRAYNYLAPSIDNFSNSGRAQGRTGGATASSEGRTGKGT
eukprot:g596.t1